MKKLVKITTVVAFMFATVAGMAKEPKLDLVSLGKAKSVLLTLDASSQGVKVKLMDADSHIIYTEKLSNGRFSKKLNLEGLKDGNYYLSTEDGLKRYYHTIVLKDNKVTIMDSSEAVKPFFRKTEDRVFVNFLNLNKSKISLKVYDEDDRLVFSETVDDKVIVEKAFNFAGAYSGNYTVVVADNANTYTEQFVVN
ncbi:hypothetical protein [Maribacter thermophilus]|uniref:hypothetical protein n=1 Tax=Maribacter thermophilus TaxID=1197874 RepID=UPI0006415679|nr:hypothetical protein [Maribacter thermophilus]